MTDDRERWALILGASSGMGEATSIALAEAARKKDADGVFKAAQALENSCTQCHMVFKKN